ncbi:ABC transporter ATP-binding protein [Mesorhizobium sp. CO1-1-8]|uniref:ABC transporter ATP-binding protein n=1 Tax=Mesorhizobium sp. CO1-1-8 TaxID=2876631 RepID=UPI001CD1853F|nr:ABC transporter ATP-binding protein [Mesorhizobium sp. CO1-1-8]MBZ9772206.1 ABC transporter ATP-binding protein [Mesorhizobium sp. CO1-1-8]
MIMLSVAGLSVSYGPIPALRDIAFELAEGETLAVVGANGAGKSTLTLTIAGVLRPGAGTVAFQGRSLAGHVPETIARQGIALVPEGRHIFEGLTVEENLLLGLTVQAGKVSPVEAFESVFAMFPILKERRSGMATRLSGGEQQQLAIARALLSQPKLLILDEPSLGLAPVMVDKVYETLKDLKRQGVTLLLVEQNPDRIGQVADRVMVLANGIVQLSGPASEVLHDERLGAAYLGKGVKGA